MIEEKVLKNQLMDGEVNVSDDSQNYLPTPPNDERDDRRLEQPNFDERIGIETPQKPYKKKDI